LPASELPRLKANTVRQLAVARSSPQAIAGDAFARLLWGDHPFGRGLPTDADVASYTIEDARAFVAKNFGAARTHVYVAGRFDRAAVEAAVRAAFGDWAAGPPPTVNPPSGAKVAQVKLIDRPDAAQSTIILGQPTIDPTSPDYVPLIVANALLGGGLLSRFNQNLREDKGWTYGVASRLAPSVRAGSWAASTDVNTQDTGPALRELYAEIARVQREAPPADELTRVKNLRSGAFVIGASSAAGLLGQLAYLDLHGLPDSWLTDYVKNVYAVTPEQVSKAARDYLDASRMTLVVVGDLKKVRADVGAVPQVKAAAKR
jgi:predicted Zn-dependent peptidase